MNTIYLQSIPVRTYITCDTCIPYVCRVGVGLTTRRPFFSHLANPGLYRETKGTGIIARFLWALEWSGHLV
jgi:hypothetical protein